MSVTQDNALGLLLAGGLARRMGGGDKAFIEMGGRPLLDYAIERARPQVSDLILNANGDAARFERFGLPVVADVIEGFAGPLAGVLTGMEWTAANAPGIEWLATFPIDAPFFPTDLIERMGAAIDDDNAEMACAESGERTHPVFALWPIRLKNDLRKAMVDEDMRKIDLWTARYKIVHVPFDTANGDPFFNINRPENVEEAEERLASVYEPVPD